MKTSRIRVKPRNITQNNLIHLILFSAFISGVLFSASMKPEKPELMHYLFAFIGSLLFSASVHGLLLLPMSMAFFGALVYRMVFAAGEYDLKLLLLNMVLVPAFFIVSVNGMNTSFVLCRMIAEGRTSHKNEYIKSSWPVILCVMAVLGLLYQLL